MTTHYEFFNRETNETITTVETEDEARHVWHEMLKDEATGMTIDTYVLWCSELMALIGVKAVSS